MKADDARRLWEGIDGARPWLELHPSDRVYFVEFARACEQRAIERVKEASLSTCDACQGEPVFDDHLGENWGCVECSGAGKVSGTVDWSALDAEIAKENDDG